MSGDRFFSKFRPAVWQSGFAPASAILEWIGPWTISTEFTENDLVENDGSLFICTTDHTSSAGDEPGVGGSWQTYWDIMAEGSAASVAGSDTQVQFNDNGDFGASANLTWDDTTLQATRLAQYEVADDTNPTILNFTKIRGESSAGQDNDYLGQLSFYGHNDNVSPEDIEYARIDTAIIDASDGDEDGQLRINSMRAGTLDNTLYVRSGCVGIGTVADTVKFYLYTDYNPSSTYLSQMWSVYDSSNPAQMIFKRTRGGTSAGQDNDYLVDFKFFGVNDNATPESIEYARISTQIIDASDSVETGLINLKAINNGSLPTYGLTTRGRYIGINAAPLDGSSIYAYNQDNPASSYFLYLNHYYDSSAGSNYMFRKLRGGATAGQDDDYLTLFMFYGYNDAVTPESIEYARISTQIVDASDGAEAGKLSIHTMNGAGVLTEAFNSAYGCIGIGIAGASDYKMRLYCNTASQFALRVDSDTSSTYTPLYFVHSGSATASAYFQRNMDNANPQVIEYSRSRGAAGQDNDYLTDLKFYGYNDNVSPEYIEYARISTQIVDASDGSEDGVIYLKGMAGGSLPTYGLTTRGEFAAVGSAPIDDITLYLLNSGNPTLGYTFFLDHFYNSATAATVAFRRRRGAAGQDSDYIYNFGFYGYNDNVTPESIQFARISTQIVDASDGSEVGQLVIQAMHNGSLTSGFYQRGANCGIGYAGATTKFYVWDTDTGNTVTALVGRQDNDEYAGQFRLNRYRASATAGQAGDDLFALMFFGYNAAGTPEDTEFARIITEIVDPTDGSEDGKLDIQTMRAGSLTSSMLFAEGVAGVGSYDATIKFYIQDNSTDFDSGQLFKVEQESGSSSCTVAQIVNAGDGDNIYSFRSANDAAGQTIRLGKYRGAAGQDDDVLTSLIFEGENDAGSPETIAYCQISASIEDASDSTEKGQLDFQVQGGGGSLASRLTLNGTGISVFGATPSAQAAYQASPTATTLRDVLIAFGFMAAS